MHLNFVVSALAIGTLLVSGVFAAAPYVVFLAPVTALGIGLPFIIGAAVFSAAVIALSATVISKNKTISEKDAQLVRQAEEINAKDRAISEKDIQLAEKIELITTKDKKIAEDRLKVEIADSTAWLIRGTINCTVQLAKGAFNGALHYGKHTYNNLPSAKSVTETFNNSYGTSVKYTKEAFNSVGNGLKSVNKVAVDSTVQLAKGEVNDWEVELLAVGLIATYAVTRFGVINNSLMQSANSVGDHTLSSNLPLTYSSLTHQQTVQSKVDEAIKMLADANKQYEDQSFTTAEDSINHKDVVSQGVMSRIFSVLRNPWNSLFNGAKKNDNNSEPKWHKDLHKSEDLEKIIDGGILDNLFYPKVDNGINTSKRPGNFSDSVELKRLTTERPTQSSLVTAY